MLWKPKGFEADSTPILAPRQRNTDLLTLSPHVVEIFEDGIRYLDQRVDDIVRGVRLASDEAPATIAEGLLVGAYRMFIDKPVSFDYFAQDQYLLPNTTFHNGDSVEHIIFDSLQAYMFTAQLVSKAASISGDLDFVLKGSLPNFIECVESTWFVELCRDMSAIYNSYYSSGEVGAGQSAMAISAFLLREPDFIKYIEKTSQKSEGTPQYTLSDDGRAYLHNLLVAHNKKDAPDYAMTADKPSSGCPARHRRVGSNVLVGFTHEEDMASWQKKGLLHEEGSSIVYDYDSFTEGAMFLGRLLRAYELKHPDQNAKLVTSSG